MVKGLNWQVKEWAGTGEERERQVELRGCQGGREWAVGGVEWAGEEEKICCWQRGKGRWSKGFHMEVRHGQVEE